MIEAKFNVTSDKERNDAFDQGRSYAKLLGVSRMGIVARQGIWIYLTTDGKFDRNLGEAFTWADLKEPERFARLLDLIGKDSLLRMQPVTLKVIIMNADHKEAAFSFGRNMAAETLMLADTNKSTRLDRKRPLIHNLLNYWTSGRVWVIMVD